MRYMLLIYASEKDWSYADRESCYQESAQLAQELHKQNKLISTSPLQPIASATTVRMREGRRIVTDGPFAETREQLGGYFMVDAKDLDEAISIAGRLPGAQRGTVEVRPVLEIAGLPEELRRATA